MPKVTSIKEILAMDDGMPVAARGTLTAVYDAKTGENENGEWSLQNCKLTDGTGEIKVVLKDREAMPKSWIDKEVEITCIQSDKHGWIGCKTKDDKYNGKVTRCLWVTGTGEISIIEDNGEPAHTPARGGTTTKPRQDEPHPTTQGNLMDVKAHLMQGANGMLLCLDAATYVADQYEKKHQREMTDDQFQAITSTLFIALDRGGNIAKMSKFPMQAVKHPPQKEPDPEPEPEPESEPKRNEDNQGRSLDPEIDDIPF